MTTTEKVVFIIFGILLIVCYSVVLSSPVCTAHQVPIILGF